MSDSQDNENVELDPTLDFLAGTVAGVSGIVVGFPFDTVKYRFQNPAPNVQYRSTLHALTTITREERLRGLFKGISSPLASAPLLNGLLFASYRFLLKVQVRPDDAAADQQQMQEPTLGQIFLAGAGCGLASTLLTTPIELIKTQQQKQQQRLSADGQARVASARTVAAHIFRAGGVPALYRGLSATILRDVGGFGMYFYGYEATLRLFAPIPRTPRAHDDPLLAEVEETLAHRSWVGLLLAGGAAGVLGWVATFPFDVLKTRMQAHLPLRDATATTTSAHVDSSTWGTARAMYAESGSRVFWRGLAPTLVRAVPVNMAVFGTFEGIVWAFS
ncbi:carnitine/acyl carnitine carrier [Lactarius indigo]|nr:carnitine/acyl carnitine carrier [Lactarius indigo]